MSQKSKKLLHAIGDIDDQLIEEANTTHEKKKRAAVYRWFYGAAACIVGAVSIGIAYRVQTEGAITSSVQSSTSSGEKPHSSVQSSGASSSSVPVISGIPSVEDLPTVTPWQSYQFGGGGMGYEGYIVTDIGELKNANPWTEDAGLATLPVFHNVYASTSQYPEEVRERKNLPLLEGKRADAAEMEALARSVAGDIGAVVESVEVDPTEEYLAAIKEKLESVGDSLSEEDTLPTRVTLTCSGDISIEVDTELNARIEFNTPISLPEGYRFGYHASYEDMTAAGEYLMEEYKDLLRMEKPVLNVIGGDRNIYGEQSFSCYIYEGAGDLTQQILNYRFNTVRISPNSEGKLWLIDITRFDLSDKLGDYPIYTLEEAKERLLEGYYITSVPEAFPGAGKIGKAELVYRGMGEITIMPYYCFYAELPEDYAPGGTADGKPLKDYGAYYVPAVREEYVDMPAYDGSFN